MENRGAETYMEEVYEPPLSGRSPRPSTACETLELILPPPMLVASPASRAQQVSNALLPVGSCNLEVVLHDPRNQKMVVWDANVGSMQVQSTAPAVRVCPFCQQTLPDDGTKWRSDWTHDPEGEASYMAPHYFSLLGAHLQQQTGPAAARASTDNASTHRGAPPTLRQRATVGLLSAPIPSAPCERSQPNAVASSCGMLVPALNPQSTNSGGAPAGPHGKHRSLDEITYPQPPHRGCGVAALAPSTARPLLPAPAASPSQTPAPPGSGALEPRVKDVTGYEEAEDRACIGGGGGGGGGVGGAAWGAQAVQHAGGGMGVGVRVGVGMSRQACEAYGGHVAGGVLSECLNSGYYSRFFESVRRIGTGAYGSVYECRHVLDGEVLGTYAVKVCPVGDNRQWLRKVLREVHHLQALSHDNVVRYMHSWLEEFQASVFSPLVPSLFILMQLADSGNLHSRLGLDLAPSEREVLAEEDILQDLVDLAQGLAYLHGIGIIHRDLKPENVLVHSDAARRGGSGARGGGEGSGGGERRGKRQQGGVVRVRRHRLIISDLGQSQHFSSASRRTGCTGTVRFTAPEMLEETSADGVMPGGGYSMRRQFVKAEWTYAADVWSLGAILYCLCFSATPWEETEDLDELAQLIICGAPLQHHQHQRGRTGRNKDPPRSAALLKLMDSTLSHDAAARPNLAALLASPILQQAMAMRMRMEGSGAMGMAAEEDSSRVAVERGDGTLQHGHARREEALYRRASPVHAVLTQARSAKVTRVDSERDLSAKGTSPDERVESGTSRGAGGGAEEESEKRRRLETLLPAELDESGAASKSHEAELTHRTRAFTHMSDAGEPAHEPARQRAQGAGQAGSEGAGVAGTGLGLRAKEASIESPRDAAGPASLRRLQVLSRPVWAWDCALVSLPERRPRSVLAGSLAQPVACVLRMVIAMLLWLLDAASRALEQLEGPPPAPGIAGEGSTAVGEAVCVQGYRPGTHSVHGSVYRALTLAAGSSPDAAAKTAQGASAEVVEDLPGEGEGGAGGREGFVELHASTRETVG